MTNQIVKELIELVADDVNPLTVEYCWTLKECDSIETALDKARAIEKDFFENNCGDKRFAEWLLAYCLEEMRAAGKGICWEDSVWDLLYDEFGYEVKGGSPIHLWEKIIASEIAGDTPFNGEDLESIIFEIDQRWAGNFRSGAEFAEETFRWEIEEALKDSQFADWLVDNCINWEAVFNERLSDSVYNYGRNYFFSWA